MITAITAKSLLHSAKTPDPWFGIKYTMNLYRGCQHQCIYCDSRSSCYGIENFNHDILIKSNALDLLQNELPRKRVKGTIGTGSMNDPYMPVEAEQRLTRRALEIIAQHRFPVHIITKSDLVLRDVDVLRDLSGTYAAVTFTITTADDDLGLKLEPGAPKVSRRLQAMRALADAGILTGVTMMPILPFIEDSADNIRRIVELAHDHGAKYIIPAFGVTLRDRQRDHYYAQLDRLFPGMRQKYQQRYKDQYSCPVPNEKHLGKMFKELCMQYQLPDRMPFYQPATKQLSLF
jgi:DNA repair photolyase